MTEEPVDVSKPTPPTPSKPNFAGAVLLSVLLVIAWGFNYVSGDSPVVPSWLLYGLMLGILFLLGVDVSKIFRRGDS
jgi:hypothetical protein